MIYLLYKWIPSKELLLKEACPRGDLTLMWWRPSWTAFVPPTLRFRHIYFWLEHQLRLFGTAEYRVLLFLYQGLVVHRTCLLPSASRWHFMAKEDLQLGLTWTHPDWRGRGLAKCGAAHAIAESIYPGRTFWYLVAQSNLASIAVAEKLGFELDRRLFRDRRSVMPGARVYREEQ